MLFNRANLVVNYLAYASVWCWAVCKFHEAGFLAETVLPKWFASVQLPDNVDPKHVEAKVEHGELFVTVPKSKQTAQTDHVVQVK